MAWYRCMGSNGGSDCVISLSFDGEHHNTQSNRTITIENTVLSSPITAQTNCVGILSIPVVMPIGTNCILVKYRLQAPSYIGGVYSATIFCSDTQMTGLTDRTSSYGNKVLTEKALNTGDTDYFYDAIDFPSTASYFNIQLGTSNFESLELFAVSSDIIKLPSYIYNVGNCAFNTNHIHTANTKVVFKAEIEPFYAPNGYSIVFGARNGTYNANAFGFDGRFNSNRHCFFRTGREQTGDLYDSQTTSSPYPPFEPCIFTAEDNKIEWYRERDSAVVRSITATDTVIDEGIAPMAIFAGNKSTQSNGWDLTDYAVMKLYWFEIYENDVLTHRFVPAYSNGQYCLYDTVDETYIYDTVNNGANVRGFIN